MLPGGSVFGAEQSITGAEAALLLQNALALPVTTLSSAPADRTELSLAVLAENGIMLNSNETLNRGQVAQTLYHISKLSATAPGLQVLSRQK